MRNGPPTKMKMVIEADPEMNLKRYTDMGGSLKVTEADLFAEQRAEDASQQVQQVRGYQISILVYRWKSES